eukprot:2845932-Amphidinium_carterae.1
MPRSSAKRAIRRAKAAAAGKHMAPAKRPLPSASDGWACWKQTQKVRPTSKWDCWHEPEKKEEQEMELLEVEGERQRGRHASPNIQCD